EQIDTLHEELIDRFGLLPEAAKALLETHRLRLLAKTLGIIKIDASESAAMLHFEPSPPIDPMRIIQFIQSNRHAKLSGQDKLRLDIKAPDLKSRVEAVRAVMRTLA
ncbi:MAG: TRCF domain-containing protein, partial [Pigmentiphaga sp.]